MIAATKQTNQQITESLAHYIIAKFEWVNGYKTYTETNRIDFTYDYAGLGAILQDEVHKFIEEIAPDKGFRSKLIYSDLCLVVELS